jgi:hypothetical protein
VLIVARDKAAAIASFLKIIISSHSNAAALAAMTDMQGGKAPCQFVVANERRLRRNRKVGGVPCYGAIEIDGVSR